MVRLDQILDLPIPSSRIPVAPIPWRYAVEFRRLSEYENELR